tara:strand:- start:1776 stop:2456 length:681 start_codon:yes stop_codon:yes gene_type:complete
LKKILVISNKIYGNQIYHQLKLLNLPYKFYLITQKDKFNFKNIKKINPTYIFIPYWSFFVPKNIYANYECINFHITDLPYGRGGTPLQNLILRKFKKTKITAFKCDDILDGGNIYLKKPLSLNGTAKEILTRASDKIFKMIIKILNKKIIPKPQKGKIYKFKRRNHSDSRITSIKGLRNIYDFIRMLDAEEYPKAFIDTNHFKFEFSNAKIYKNNITASVKIYKKK